MSSIECPNFLETLRNEAKHSQPGILPKNTKFESYIGHTVINISDISLDQYQIKALEKGLTFCPTPGQPDKSQIWLDFKEFHRRLELMEFFSRDKTDNYTDDPQISQSIIDFMNQMEKKPHTPVCTRLGRCKYCPLIKKMDSITCNFTKKSYQPIDLPKHITCELSNIIYLISCTKCNKHYVGETCRAFRMRMYEHKSSVSKDSKKSTPVSRHFSSDGHSQKHMQFSVLEWCTPKFESDNTSKRRRIELCWIFKLHSLSPIGINQFV